MLAMFGLEDTSQLFASGIITFEGFLSTEYFFLWPFVLTIYALTIGSGLASRELERGTLDVLLSHPIRRYRLLLAKIGAYTAVFIGLAATSFLAILVPVMFIDVDPYVGRLLVAHGVGALMVLAIFAYATFLSVMYLSSGKALVVAGGVTLLMYIVDIAGGIVDSIEFIRYASLFNYFDAFEILNRGTVDAVGVAVFVAVAAGFGVGSLVMFERRDLVS
jgi:ABC-type transport system involved in multi-copper enzyme maturation permease subunit